MVDTDVVYVIWQLLLLLLCLFWYYLVALRIVFHSCDCCSVGAQLGKRHSLNSLFAIRNTMHTRAKLRFLCLWRTRDFYHEIYNQASDYKKFGALIIWLGTFFFVEPFLSSG